MTTPSHDEMIAAVQDMISALEYERDHLPDFDATGLWLWRGVLAQLEASRWRPIAEAPRDGRFILLRFPPSHNSPGVAVGAWVGEGWWLTAIWAGTSTEVEPSYFARLPEGGEE